MRKSTGTKTMLKGTKFRSVFLSIFCFLSVCVYLGAMPPFLSLSINALCTLTPISCHPARLRECSEEKSPVIVIEIDVFPSIPTRHYVINRPAVFDSDASCRPSLCPFSTLSSISFLSPDPVSPVTSPHKQLRELDQTDGEICRHQSKPPFLPPCR